MKPKPCPFCGTEYVGVESIFQSFKAEVSHVYCPHCNARGPDAATEGFTREQKDEVAIFVWNERSEEAVQLAQRLCWMNTQLDRRKKPNAKGAKHG